MTLREQYVIALQEAQTAKDRNLDPGTISQAVGRALELKRRLEREQSNGDFSAALERATNGMSNGGRGRPSLGQEFLDSETGQFLLKHRGKFPTGAWTSPAAELMATTLSEDSASGGDLVITDYQRGILPLPLRPTKVADLLGDGTTN